MLELGCGTGRTLFPVAAARIDVTGVEQAPEMLASARRHAQSLPEEVARRVRLCAGDMRALPALAGPFGLVSLPYRTFQHLLTPADQAATLTGVRRQLRSDGRLVLNQFDPTLDIADILHADRPATADIGDLPIDTEFDDEATGRPIRVRYRRGYDLAAQVLQQEFYYEHVEGERVVEVERGQLTLRYTYRYEMEWLLQACGFRVVSLWGGFDESPYPGYGEQVWVAAKA